MNSGATILEDRETVELLRGRPDLLAIADAVRAGHLRPATARRRRRTLLLAAATVALVAGVCFSVVLSYGGGLSPGHSVTSGSGGRFEPLSSISVSSVSDAAALLPFRLVLPPNATPTNMQVSDPRRTSASGAWFSAQFDTSNDGSYQLFERASDATVATLQDWVQNSTSCSGCTTDKLVTEDGVQVAVFASPVLGLQLYWVRGDATGPILSQLVWPSDTFDQRTALAVAADMISQSG
ncbi:MAG: hypothetical protein ACRDLM_07200 [Gaiellaceae bacterium]